MKKRYYKWLLPLFGAILLLGSGCGKETPPEIQEDIIQIEFDESIPNVLTLSRDEIYALDLSVFRDSIRQYVPQYRDYFKIPEDYDMTADDWESLRDMVVYQLYGIEEVKEVTVEPVPEDFAEDLGIDTKDPDWIYEAPNKLLIEPMTADEFREYFIGLFVYSQGDENVEMIREGIYSLSDEDILQRKEKFMNDLPE